MRRERASVDNREKVIKGLEQAIAFFRDRVTGDMYDKWLHASVDALALLKAQEAVKPIMHYVPDGKRSSAAWQCGNCLIDIGYGVNYCYNCGRAVKWE